MSKKSLKVELTGRIEWRNERGGLHRLDGPAVEHENGTKQWFVNEKLHRLDGPAIEYANGDKCWYVHDKRHRLDGPAVERTDGMKIWYVEDELIYCKSQEEFERLIKLKALW